MTQHQKILQLHENREWICQNEYHAISWCPHKRRRELELGGVKDLEGNKIPAGKYHFESKDCEHGIKGSRDYLLVWVEPTFSELAGSVDSRTGLIQLTEMGKSIWKEKVAKNFEQAEKLNL